MAGTATHPLDNVRGNILMLIDGDPDKLFGLSRTAGRLTASTGSSTWWRPGPAAPIDHEARYGPVDIAPGPIVDACGAMGERLARAAARASASVLATGPPVGLALLYHALDGLLAGTGRACSRRPTAHGWRERPPRPRLGRSRTGAAWPMLTDGREPRHTHRPDAMERILAEARPDLVVADHGFAGAAIEAGVETLSIADVNDPALIVAKAQGRTDRGRDGRPRRPRRLLALLPGWWRKPSDLRRGHGPAREWPNGGYPPSRRPPTIRPS